MLLVLFLITASLAVSFDLSKDDMVLFSEFKSQFSRKYETPVEEEFRFQIFKANLAKFRKHNAANKGYTMGINIFADKTSEEIHLPFAKTLKMKAQKSYFKKDLPKYQPKNTSKLASIPDSYASCGSESDVNYCANINIDQGLCGSCYAVSVAQQYTTLYAYLTEQNGAIKRQEMSAQQLIDCSKKWTGCEGGLSDDVLDGTTYPQIASDYSRDYQYLFTENGKQFSCDTQEAKSPMKTSYTTFHGKSWSQLKEIIYNNKGFVSGIKAEDDLSYYTGGIYTSSACMNQVTDHMIVVDGYGECDGIKYLWVRNSWGKDWGVENGHFKILFDTLCGINGDDEGQQDVNYVVTGTLTSYSTSVNEGVTIWDDVKDLQGCVLIGNGVMGMMSLTILTLLVLLVF
ncbi:Xylem cysteine proteinase 2 precursor, putative [Entamoeba invadens IP1]|uniref:Xylem cysteine proteinase 2 precursor, putative n=1 Tax=Entamoeba invadens IP1 TaxID=370355 RepID=UPI0002C3DCF1|nr:Xylem cysteine proteinase 2 precursor, putative [Entamoeba invadens IP1]ELP85201.1 Xylem cysteine proteinase 2 precursor, putative [Entamoeba invadens IP1]|eukprot:XP_004184547.1 Xylem cysteine proteinase 2 precursor, putative [Entamoeba invadens IP1]